MVADNAKIGPTFVALRLVRLRFILLLLSRLGIALSSAAHNAAPQAADKPVWDHPPEFCGNVSFSCFSPIIT
jgi:hypothetical protein